MFVATEADT